MGQGKGQRTKKGREAEEITSDEQDARQKKVTAEGKEKVKEMDELIDEIDAVLEENTMKAEDYVQRGGQ